MNPFSQDRVLPRSYQYSFDIQRELPGNILFEIGYSGNLNRRLQYLNNQLGLNYLPLSEMNRLTSTGAVDTAYYTGKVTNPMAGLIPNNGTLNGATIQRTLLMYAYPQFNGVTMSDIPLGQARYDAMNIKFTKRFSSGLSFLSSYGISKNLRQIRMLNAQDFGGLTGFDNTPLVKESDQNIDIPQKFVIAGIYELPFGKGRKFAATIPGAVNQIIGGWQVNWDVTYQKGNVVDYPNAPQKTPGSAALSNPTTQQYINTSLWSGVTVPNLTYQTRTFPYLFSDIRRPGYKNWDASLSKDFPIYERMKLQFRFEMVNMMNHPFYANMQSTDVTNALFGQLNPTQSNLPRFLKLAMHFTW
jgi:hypothetical protein